MKHNHTIGFVINKYRFESTYRWVVGLLGGNRSAGKSNCTVGVEAFVYGVRACTGKAGVCGLGDVLYGGLVDPTSFTDCERQDVIESSRY